MIAQLTKSYLKLGFSKVYQRLLAYFLFEGRPLTTKGRFINKFVFFFFKVIDVLTPSRAYPPVGFLVGVGRSGTTILGKVLSAQTDIAYLNEPKAAWHFAFKNEDLIGSYSKENNLVSLRPHLSQEKNGASRLMKIYSIFQWLTGTKLVLDKYPELIYRHKELKNVLPEAKCIAIIRNGYAVANSIEKWNALHSSLENGQEANWWGLEDRKWTILVNDIIKNPSFSHWEGALRNLIDNTQRGIVEWWYASRELQILRDKKSDQLLIVRYEDLFENKVDSIKEILDFLELTMSVKLELFIQTELREKKGNYTKPSIPPFMKEDFREIQNAFGYEI